MTPPAGSPMTGVQPAAAEVELKEMRKRRKEETLRNFFNSSMDPTRYHLVSVMGEGAFGIVCKAIDTRPPPDATPSSNPKQQSQLVAIKRIRNALESSPMATRVLRELILLRLLRGHENVIGIRDVLVPGEQKVNDAFVVFDLMETDLATILRSKTVLLPCHHRLLLVQLLQAVAYLFESSVLHRDLKPSNILVDKECRLKVCDLGLARASFESPTNDMNLWTDYVATRWYRAPELILSRSALKYTAAIDMWSVGCIFAEMLGTGGPLFPGQNQEDQLSLILRTLGRPSAQAIESIPEHVTRTFLRSFPVEPVTPLESLFPGTDPLALDLLKRLLAFDPVDRILAPDALMHPYFAEFASQVGRRKRGVPVPPTEFVFEGMRDTGLLRKQFLQEVARYHPDCADDVMGSPIDMSYISEIKLHNNPVFGCVRQPVRSTMPINYIPPQVPENAHAMKSHVTLTETEMRHVAAESERRSCA